MKRECYIRTVAGQQPLLAREIQVVFASGIGSGSITGCVIRQDSGELVIWFDGPAGFESAKIRRGIDFLCDSLTVVG